MRTGNERVFMGYGSVESLLHRRDRGTTQLYLFASVETQATKYGNFHHRSYYLTLSLVEDGAVHYCRVPYGGAQVVTDHAGQPVPDCTMEIARIESRGTSLEGCVRAHLTRLGFAPPRDASPSFPDNVRLVGGTQRFAVLNEAKTLFVESGAT